MIIHFILIPIFFLYIYLANYSKVLNKILKITPKKITYIKVALLLVLWIIYVLLAFLIKTDTTIKLIYVGVSFINFVICIIIIGRQEKIYLDNVDVLSTWKRSARLLNLNFKVKKYQNLKLPIIYGNSKNNYIEIFPYNEEFTKYNNFDSNLDKTISIRVFNKEKKITNNMVFSYEKTFKENNKDFSYIDNQVTINNIDDKSKIHILTENFHLEVKKIIDKSIFSLNNIKRG